MNALSTLLPLLVAAPIAAAALLVLWRYAPAERLLLVAVPAATAAYGAIVLARPAGAPFPAQAIGGFPAGVAIPFVADPLTGVLLVVTGGMSAIAGWYLIATGEDRHRFVPSLALLLTAGVNGALLTADVFNLFVFIEVMLLPSYALIAVTGTWRRLGAGRLFVVVNLVTSTILLLGIAFLYGVTGTVNLATLAGRAAADPRAGAAIAVVLLALAVKAGVVPVHGWLPRAYPATSAGVMGLFSGLHTKVALYAAYRIYAVTYGGAPAPWTAALAAVTLVTMLVGALGTFGERRLRGALAYQMVAGVGHILIGLALLTPAALAAGLFYLVHHVVTMGALILTAGAVEYTYGSGRFDRLSGLARRERGAAVILALGLFSLVGLPPTSGLWGKVALAQAAAGALATQPVPATAVLAALVLASLASLVALQRMWREVWWGKPMETYRPDEARVQGRAPVPLPAQLRIPRRLLAPPAVLMAVSVAMFLGAGGLFPIADRAATGLVRLGPYVAAVLR